MGQTLDKHTICIDKQHGMDAKHYIAADFLLSKHIFRFRFRFRFFYCHSFLNVHTFRKREMLVFLGSSTVVDSQ